jgi:hypothetical protein
MDALKSRLDAAKRESETETVRVGIGEIQDLLNPNKREPYAHARNSLSNVKNGAHEYDREHEAARISLIAQREKELRKELGKY